MSLLKKFKKQKGYVEPWEKEPDKRRNDRVCKSEELEPPEQFFPEEAYSYDNPYSEYYHKQPNGKSKPNDQIKSGNKPNPNVSGNKANNTAAPGVIPSKGSKPYTAPQNGTYPPYQAPGKIGKETYVYKPRIIEKKLIILLIENTAETAKENDSIIKLSKICNETDWLYIVRYGKEVDIKKVELKKFLKKDNDINPNDLKCSEDAAEDACLWDTLVEINKIVSDLYGKVKENDKVTTKVTNIEIIGVGTCKDNCSKTSKEEGIQSFCKMLSDTRIKSKYFCLNENSFLNAAEIGFRSIGSISKSYYQHETE